MPLFDPRMALYDAYINPQAGWGTAGLGNLEGGCYDSMEPPRSAGYGTKQQLNWVAIAVALLVPFALFAGTFWTMSFEFYYQHPHAAMMFIAGAFFFSLIIGSLNTQAKRTEMLTGQRTWHYFLFMTSFVACFLGTFLGYLNMNETAVRYYDYISLRKAVNVDPGQWHGQMLLDAGEVDFKQGNRVDMSLGSLWHKSKTYCAAPIVNSGGAKLASYDFWAVGMDCCSLDHNDFSCGDLSSSSAALSGLRVMDVDEIVGYKLAVEQATAAHNIQSLRPIFLYLMKTPYKKIRSYYDEAMSSAIQAFALYFILQGVLVSVQAYTFGKSAPSGFLKDVDPTSRSERHW